MSRIMERGEATLDSRAAAIQVQISGNLLEDFFRQTQLQVFAENDGMTRDNLEEALLWLFGEAKNCAAAPIWMPIITFFENELKGNPNFKITAMTYRKVGASYNNDTQSDIYVYPGQESLTYKHVIPHELGHLYSKKCQPFDFLHDFKEAMIKDQLLDFQSDAFQNLPWELKKLLEDMRNSYEECDCEAELFPRVCIQFPIFYVLNHPSRGFSVSFRLLCFFFLVLVLHFIFPGEL